MKIKAREVAALLIASVMMFAFVSCKKESGATVSTKAVSGDAAILKGKWLRPDGGYIIDIRSVDPATGKIEAAYFNPNPIHVANAQLSQKDGGLFVLVELRDEGYPGCTYKLAYDRQNDQLKGIYYQAAVQESYDIYFVRVGEGQ